MSKEKVVMAVILGIYLLGIASIVVNYARLEGGDLRPEDGAEAYAMMQGVSMSLESITKYGAIVSIVFIRTPIIIPTAIVAYISISIASKYRKNAFTKEFVDSTHPVSYKLAEAFAHSLIGSVFWATVAYFVRRRRLRNLSRQGEDLDISRQQKQ